MSNVILVLKHEHYHSFSQDYSHGQTHYGQFLKAGSKSKQEKPKILAFQFHAFFVFVINLIVNISFNSENK